MGLFPNSAEVKKRAREDAMAERVRQLAALEDDSQKQKKEFAGIVGDLQSLRTQRKTLPQPATSPITVTEVTPAPVVRPVLPPLEAVVEREKPKEKPKTLPPALVKHSSGKYSRKITSFSGKTEEFGDDLRLSPDQGLSSFSDRNPSMSSRKSSGKFSRSFSDRTLKDSRQSSFSEGGGGYTARLASLDSVIDAKVSSVNTDKSLEVRFQSDRDLLRAMRLPSVTESDIEPLNIRAFTDQYQELIRTPSSATDSPRSAGLRYKQGNWGSWQSRECTSPDLNKTHISQWYSSDSDEGPAVPIKKRVSRRDPANDLWLATGIISNHRKASVEHFPNEEGMIDDGLDKVLKRVIQRRKKKLSHTIS